MTELQFFYVLLAIWAISFGVAHFVADPQGKQVLIIISAIAAIATGVLALLVAF